MVEAELKKGSTYMTRLTALVEAAQGEESRTHQSVNSMLQELASLTEEIDNMGANLDVTYQFKMGQASNSSTPAHCYLNPFLAPRITYSLVRPQPD